MIYIINKIVDGLCNPLAIGVLALVIAGILLARGRKRLGGGLLGGGFAWLWFWSMPVVASLVGYSIECHWPPRVVESLPEADAIVLLGGGMSACPDKVPYPTMYGAADRVWHSARLYKAGKAPIIVPTGVGAKHCEKPLLEDFGVPSEAIICEEAARNTEENALFVQRLLEERAKRGLGSKGPEGFRVLLVTSALHMPRAKLMYERYAKGLSIVPVACDHEATIGWFDELRVSSFCPSVYALGTSSYAFKEYIGYWGYKLLRR